VINFLKQIFTWWHRQTIETFLYTLFFGKFVGSDHFGNKYYTSKKGKRWVVYKGLIESTQIPSEWHLWIHFIKNKIPSKDNINKYEWQKKHEENLTGTNKAYKPQGSLSSDKKNIIKKYETWKI
jgi:NADH:ubiquinone oxidoreductase subunit